MPASTPCPAVATGGTGSGKNERPPYTVDRAVDPAPVRPAAGLRSVRLPQPRMEMPGAR